MLGHVYFPAYELVDESLERAGRGASAPQPGAPESAANSASRLVPSSTFPTPAAVEIGDPHLACS